MRVEYSKRAIADLRQSAAYFAHSGAHAVKITAGAQTSIVGNQSESTAIVRPVGTRVYSRS
jgi:hypothetical protein